MRRRSRPREGPFRIYLAGPNLVCIVLAPRCETRIAEPRTGICLYASSDLASTNLIKKGNILAEDGLQITLANTLSGRLGSMDPSIHVNVSANEHTHTCGGLIACDWEGSNRGERIHVPIYVR